MHDTYSDYPESLEGTKDAWGRDYIACVQNIQSLYTGNEDDLVDLTSTETCEIYDGVKCSVRGVKKVYGGEGDETLISHHSATMTGGSGEDIFGFIATPKMHDEVTRLNQ